MRAALLAGLSLALVACKAPVPDREAIEADAAWNASEWRDDFGDVWRVRTNSRRVSATQTAPDTGVTLRGAIVSGALNFDVIDRSGQQIGKGEATIADPHHALFFMRDMSGKETSHGLWHFDHGPGVAAMSAPPATPTPSAAATPSSPPSSPTEPAASPSETPATPPVELSPSATPPPVIAPSSTPATPAKPGDPLDLRPH